MWYQPSICDVAPHVTNLWQINTIFIRFFWQFFLLITTASLKTVHYIWWFTSMVVWGKLPQMSGFSSVNLAKYNIHCTNDGNNVSQHVVSADVVHEGEVEEAGGLDLASVRLAASIRDKVDAKLTLWRLNGCVSGASRYLKDALKALYTVEL